MQSVNDLNWESIALAAALGASAKWGYDQISMRMGWSREDAREQRRKVEQVDSHARGELARVERELKKEISDLKLEQGRMAEQIRHLPTADDIQHLQQGLGRLEREMGTALARIEGQTDMVRTIRDHLMDKG